MRVCGVDDAWIFCGFRGFLVAECTRKKKQPRHPGDIGDIGDIFRKAAKTLGLLRVHTGDISGDIFGDGDFHAQYTIACALHRSIRCYQVDAIGEPLLPKVRTQPEFGPLDTPSGSTYELRSQPFPFWQQFGISEPLPRRSFAPVNSFARRILEPRRLDFLDHPFAREWHSRANARRRIVDHPISIRARVK